MILRLLNVGLLAIVVTTAIGVIYSKHHNRMLYVELRGLEKTRDSLNVEWDRLQIEQSTYATHARVEGAARKKLAMRNVNYNEVIVVTP